jgi:hypothetical protein
MPIIGLYINDWLDMQIPGYENATYPILFLFYGTPIYFIISIVLFLIKAPKPYSYWIKSSSVICMLYVVISWAPLFLWDVALF